MEDFKPATVVSVKGLRGRSRSSYFIGMRVQAKVETCSLCDGTGTFGAARTTCPGCDGKKKRTVIYGTGISGTNAIVPDHMIRFDRA